MEKRDFFGEYLKSFVLGATTQATQGMTIQLNLHILIKCFLERFASINDPENWTTNVA